MDLRNIEYRAKPKNPEYAGKDGYIYGFLCKNQAKQYCIQPKSSLYDVVNIAIIKETISQYVCNDKNGDRVYSNDSVTFNGLDEYGERAFIDKVKIIWNKNGWAIDRDWVPLRFKSHHIKLIKQ